MDGSSIERVARVSGQSWRTFREEEEKSTKAGLERNSFPRGADREEAELYGLGCVPSFSARFLPRRDWFVHVFCLLDRPEV